MTAQTRRRSALAAVAGAEQLAQRSWQKPTASQHLYKPLHAMYPVRATILLNLQLTAGL